MASVMIGMGPGDRLVNMERSSYEEVLPIVKLAEGRVMATTRISFGRMLHSQERVIIDEVRLDAIIEDNPEGFARGFGILSAGSSITIAAHGHQRGPFSFIQPRERVQGETADLPMLRHAITGRLMPPLVVRPHDAYHLDYTYEGPPLPIGFLRLVMVGTREEIER